MRERVSSQLAGEVSLHLALQEAPAQPAEDVLYIHGATFPSALSIFFRFDGRSWADALNEAGFNAWGLDFAGYGDSQRPAAMSRPAHESPPIGRAAEVAEQVRRAIAHIQAGNGGAPINVIAHSWGTVVAGMVAATDPHRVKRLVLFGPVARRAGIPGAAPQDAWRDINIWQQYRRFIEDTPPGTPPVLLDSHMDAWSAAYLASDPQGATRTPRSVRTPSGPAADIASIWSGEFPYDMRGIRCPLLVVRGEWDSVSNDDDARWLLDAAGSGVKRDLKLARGTHLMHLEENRGALHAASVAFLRHGV